MTRVAILGGGAAGISAARSLQVAGHETRIFEARDRLGGRAYTDYELAVHPVEMGAEFIHGDAVSAAATWDWVREFAEPTTGAAHCYEIWSQLEGKLVDGATLQDAFGTEPLSSLSRLTKSWLETGGEDVSLAVIALNEHTDDKELEKHLHAQGLVATTLSRSNNHDHPGHSLYFLAIEGFVQQDSLPIANFLQSAAEVVTQVTVVGSYAKQLHIDK